MDDRDLGELAGLRQRVAHLERELQAFREQRDNPIPAAQQQLEAIVQASPLPIVALTRDGAITLWNAAAERLFGWTAAEVVGRPLPFISEDKLDEHRAMREQDLSGNGFTGREITRRRKDGSAIDLSVSTAPIRDGHGGVAGIMSIYADVTERRRMEFTLRESEKKFRAVTEQSPLATQVISPEGRVVSANRAWEELWGVTTEQIRDFDAFGDPQLRERGILPYLLRARDGEAVEIPPMIFVPDRGKRMGEEVWVRSFAYPVLDDRGSVREIVLVQADVTEERRSAQALRESEQRLDLAVHAHQIGIFDWDIATGRVVWSDQEQRLFGLEPGTFEGNIEGWSKRVNGEDQARLMQEFRDCWAERCERLSFHFRIHTPDRQTRYIEGSGRFFYKGDGTPLRMVGVNIDVTDRVANAERLKFALNAARLGDWDWDAKTDLVTFSERAAEIFAIPPGPHMTWTQMQQLLHPDDRERVGAEVQRVVRQRTQYDIEYRLTGEGREGRWVAAKGLASYDANGAVVSMTGLVQDVTERRNLLEREQQARHEAERLFAESRAAQAALERANAELRRANADLEQFAYSASHDLREPLRMVAVYSQMLQRRFKGKLDSEADEYLDYAVRGALRMEALIRDLLAYTQAAAISEHDDVKARTDGTAVLQEVLANLRSPIEESGATVEFSRLPLLRVQHVHLTQLLQNLIGNALKYRGPQPPEIKVRAEISGRMCTLCVSDNGIGIEPQYAHNVFGIFKRLHNDARYEGTGIGLAICHKIVERYGGRIWVESEGAGKGAAFFCTLPIVTEQAVGVGQSTASEGADSSLT